MIEIIESLALHARTPRTTQDRFRFVGFVTTYDRYWELAITFRGHEIVKTRRRNLGRNYGNKKCKIRCAHDDNSNKWNTALHTAHPLKSRRTGCSVHRNGHLIKHKRRGWEKHNFINSTVQLSNIVASIDYLRKNNVLRWYFQEFGSTTPKIITISHFRYPHSVFRKCFVFVFPRNENEGYLCCFSRVFKCHALKHYDRNHVRVAYSPQEAEVEGPDKDLKFSFHFHTPHTF